MRFSTPWSPEVESWQKDVPEVSAPGLDPACSRPMPGRPPVIHRFHQLILLPRGPFDLPPSPPPISYLPTAHATSAVESGMGASPPPPTIIGNHITTPNSWIETRFRWGQFIAYEQAWYWLGASIGELIESLSLTPQEELEIQVFTWDRTKLSRDFQTTDLVDQKSETSLTMHSSAQVTRRMEEETHWDLGVNVGFSSGVTAGLELGVGQSSSDVMERRREQTQDLTSRTARQMRSERRVAISTVHEIGIEERSTRKLVNPNPTRTVTFNFYETLSHFRVEIAPVEAIWVVAIPNRLPNITPNWVACHEGILREHLLDIGQSAGFDSARRLARRFPTDLIQEAVGRLYTAFTNQDMGPEDININPFRADPATLEPILHPANFTADQPTSAEKIGRTILAILTGGTSEIAYAVKDQITDETAEAGSERYSYHFIKDFLYGVLQTPSVPGLLAAMKYVADWYKPFSLAGQPCYYPVSADAEAALGFANSILVQALGDASPEISLAEDATEESKKAAREAWLEWKQNREAQIKELVEDQMEFEALRCHITSNILHYMRPIWLAEDPGQRLARLSSELLGGTGNSALFAQLVEQPLLGFHLNCSVFPVQLGNELEAALHNSLETRVINQRLPEPEGPTAFTRRISADAKEMKTRIVSHYIQLAEKRFKMDGQRLLDTAINEASRRVLTCKDTQEVSRTRSSLSPTMLPEVIAEAGKYIYNRLEAAKDTSAYLSENENQTRLAAENYLETLANIKIDDEATSENIGQLHSTVNRVENIIRQTDFKPIVVTLPDGGYYCEPVLGQCSAAEEFRSRSIEAEIISGEATTRQAVSEAERKERRLIEGNLENDENAPVIRVILKKEDT